MHPIAGLALLLLVAFLIMAVLVTAAVRVMFVRTRKGRLAAEARGESFERPDATIVWIMMLPFLVGISFLASSAILQPWIGQSPAGVVP